MSLLNVIRLYRARLRARRVLVQEGLAIVGIAIGVALLFASQVASTSLSRSVPELTRQVVGEQGQWQLQARGPGGVDERMLSEVRGLPGVQAALPVLEQQASVIGPGGQRAVELIGTDPRAARIGGPLLRRFSAAQLSAQRAIALPAPLAHAIKAGALQTVKLQIGGRELTTLLGATLQEGDIGGLVRTPIALAPIAYAQRISGLQGRITRIFVSPRRGNTRVVKAELLRVASRWGVNLKAANYDATLFGVAVAPQSQSETLFSGISALVAFMFALNAMLVTVPLRRQLIEELRPAGGTRGMMLKILLFDALVLGGIACAMGLVLGELLSVEAFRANPGYLSFAFPVGSARIVTWQNVVFALAAGVAAAVVGVLWPLRDILMPARSPAGGPSARRLWVPIRLAVGLAALASVVAVILLRPSAAVAGNVLLILALVCLLPFLFDGLVALFARAQPAVNDLALRLAVISLRTPQTRVRSLAIATTAAIAVLGIVEFQGTQANLTKGLDASARGIDSAAAVWVAPGGEANAFATTQFSSSRAETLSSLPGVERLSIYRGSFLDWGRRRLWILGMPSSVSRLIPPGELVRGGLAAATARVRLGGWAVLSQALASEHHLKVGQPFILPAPRPTVLRLAALSSNLGWPPGAVIMNSADYAWAWGDSAPSAYLLEAKPGSSPGVIRRLADQSLGSETALTVETVREREQRHYALADQGLSRLTQIRLLVLVAAVLAVTGAMSAMMWQRRDLLAFRKVDGYGRWLLLRSLAWESGLLLAAGCSIGAVFGLLGQLLGSHFLASVTGFPIVFDVEVSAALSSFALVSAVAFGVVLLSGYHVVRVPPRMVGPAY